MNRLSVKILVYLFLLSIVIWLGPKPAMATPIIYDTDLKLSSLRRRSTNRVALGRLSSLLRKRFVQLHQNEWIKSLEKRLWEQRWPSFKPEEILSPNAISRKLSHKLCPHSLDTLQLFRDRLCDLYGRDIRLVVNHGSARLRGVRTAAENSSIRKAAKDSMHVAGRAFDISSPDISIEELYKAAVNSKLWGGVGRYSTWVHVDTRYSPSGIVTWNV